MYEKIAESRVEDLAALVEENLDFVPSASFYGWMVAESVQGEVYLRFGRNFPEEDMWGLWLGDGWHNFTGDPKKWQIPVTGDTWRSCAQRSDEALSKEEITEVLLREN